MAATKRSSNSPLRGQFCLQVPNCKVSPCSQPLLIWASCLVVLTLAHASLVQKLSNSVLLRCPAMTKQSDSPTSKCQDEQDSPGVVLSCFDRNDFSLRILWPDLLLAMFFRHFWARLKIGNVLLILILPLSPKFGQECMVFWRSLEISRLILNVVNQGYRFRFFIFPHLSLKLTMPLFVTTVLLCLKLLMTYSSVIHDLINILILIALLNCAISPCMFCHLPASLGSTMFSG